MKATIAGLIPNPILSAFIGQIFLAGACLLPMHLYATVDDWPATAYYAPESSLSVMIGVEETQAASALACMPSVQISLDQQGQAVVTPAMLVLDPAYPLNMYIVDIMGPLTNVVTCDNIGQELMASVQELPTGNFCMSSLTVEDKLKPVMICVDDTIPCNVDLQTLDYLSFLDSAVDNCDEDLSIYYEYTITDLNCDPDGFAAYIDITYHATDDYGNTNSCDQRIYLEKYTLDDVEFPADTMLNCIGADPDPEVIGGPTIEGEPIDLFCELLAWKTDNVIPMCSGQTKIIRLWSVMDWCTGETRTDPQEILIIDTVPPDLICPDDITLGTSTLVCSAPYILPQPVATDVCSDDALIDYWFTISSIPGIFVPGQQVVLELGDHIITVSATDDCNNTATCQYTVTVVDDDDPVLVCSNLNITLDAMGMAFLYANSTAFNATDNCGIALREIRRMDDSCDTPENLVFGPFVKFCCDDVGDTVMVVFQATDIAGNTAICMIQVTVKDADDPIALCRNACIFLGPDGNVTLSPDSVDNGSYDNCEIVSKTLSDSLFNCDDIGAHIIVVLTVADVQGNTASCTAMVEVKDTVPPEAHCRDITVDLDSLGMVTIQVDSVNNGSTDNCAIDTMYLSEDMFTCMDTGANMVMLIVVDEGGLADTCIATVTVNEMPPTVTGMDITVYLDEMGEVTIMASDVDGVVDDCSMPTLMLTPDTFDCDSIGPRIVTLIATDDSGFMDTCTAIVTVLDTLPPECNTMDLTIQLDADGSVTLSGDALDDGSTDNCEIASITINPNTFTCNQAGTTVVVVQTVTDGSGNSSTCSANVTVEDNVDPICMTQNIVVQLNAAGMATIGNTAVDNGSSDNCGIQSITLSQTSFDCGDVGMVVVTQTVTDVNGNTSTCTATITVEDNIDPLCMTQDITVFLDAAGSAMIAQNAVNDGSSDACGIQMISLTPTTFDCGDVGVVVVTQTVTDVNGNTSTCTAQVTVVDDMFPFCAAHDLTVTPGAGGSVTILPSQIDDGSTDNCTFTLDVMPAVFTCDSIGDHVVVLTVTDASGNSTTCTATVTVEDPGALMAVCNDMAIVLNGNGMASVDPEEVGMGSGGGCSGGLTFTLSQMDFTCADIGPNVVTLTVTDSEGNSDTCTATITVSDNTPPTIVCPQNTTVNCDVPINLNNLAAQFGSPTVSDNCPPVTVTPTVEDNRNNCGQGTIVRTFVASDPSGNTSQCVQTITVQDPNPFDSTNIFWPPAVVMLGQCSSTDPGPGNQPVIDSGSCSDPVVSFVDLDTVVMVDNDPLTPCIVITRMWVVTDLCQVNAVFTFTQMIIYNDNVGPLFTPLNDITVTADSITCQAPVTLIASATDCGMATPITNSFNGGGANASGNYPIGTTTVVFTSTDGCGNISTMDVDVTVIDPHPAIIACEKIIRFLDEELLGVFVLAEEFVVFEPGSCTTMDDFLFSYSPTDPLDSLMFFGCDVPPNTVEPVNVYTFDLNGIPIDTCMANLDFRDTSDACHEGPSIAGQIFNEHLEVIKNVPVLISDPSMQTITTTESGKYMYRDLEYGNTYTVRPFWNVNHKNGVSTLDLIAILKHLLGIKLLDSPYQLIAADATNNGHISVADLIEIRRLLLDIIPAYTKNTSWRFIDAHYEFPDEDNPWSQVFPESMTFDPILDHMRHMDYIGVKVGDVNNSASLIQSEDIDVRSGDALELVVNDDYVEAGEIVEIPISVMQYQALTGYQFGLRFDPSKATFVSVTFPTQSFLSEEWVGLSNVDQGLITSLWYESRARDVESGQVLFNLVLRTTQKTRVAELLSLQALPLAAEAYRGDDEIVPVRLSINGTKAPLDFAVFQNKPNPFTEGTIIPVQLPEAGIAVLEVYTYEGKMVYRQTKAMNLGYNEFELRAEELNQSGMFYYTISTDRFRGTRKMVLLE